MTKPCALSASRTVISALVVFVVGTGMGGEALTVTIDQTSVSLYAGICISDWRRLLIVGEPGHWGGIIGLSSVGPWSHAKRWCDGGHPSVAANLISVSRQFNFRNPSTNP